MSYASNDRIRVSYDDVGDREKPALVLTFGFGMSSRDWFELGYVARLLPFFRLIAIEPRGHGDSTAPIQEQQYALPMMVSDIRAVLDHLSIPRAIMWGYSLGAKITLAFAGAHSDRVSGLVLGGLELHSSVDLTDDVVTSTLRRGGRAWRALWQRMVELPTGMSARLSRVDVAALIALRRAEAHWPSLADVPSTIAVPCLLYAGEHCFFRSATAAMEHSFPHARYIERQGRNHFAVMLDADWICDEVIASFAAAPHERAAPARPCSD